jgi:hypothetical protein
MMNWDSQKPQRTILLDDIFDSEKGWDFSNDQVPIKRTVNADGNTVYTVTVDEIVVTTFEQSKWKDGVIRSVSANRLVAMVKFTGINITNPTALLLGSFRAKGLPSFGVDDSGSLYLHTGFPIAPDFPLDLARKQLMVCMGLLAEEAAANLQVWTKRPKTKADFDWDTAKKVASIAGTFLRAFLGT